MAIRIICKKCKTPHLFIDIADGIAGRKEYNEEVRCKNCSRVLISFKEVSNESKENKSE